MKKLVKVNRDKMKFNKKILELIIEGGWASSLTQDTKLTPAVVEECVKLYDKFVVNFNKYLADNTDLPPVEPGEPQGSSHYYKKDLIDNPDKEYGDVDIMLYIPRIEGTSDNANQEIYKKAVLKYCEGRSDVQTENGKFLIFKLNSKEYVQIDLLMAYIENKEWARARYTPERGTKGAIGGTMYNAIGQVLNLSLNIHGAQMKLKDGVPVSFKNIKDVELINVTKNFATMGLDICKFYYKNITGKNEGMKVSSTLKAYPGIKQEDVKNHDLAKMAKGIGETLEMNGLLGKGPLSNISSYDDYINKIATIFKNKMEKAIDSQKFDKAQGEEGLRKAKETKEKFRDGMIKMLKDLK